MGTTAEVEATTVYRWRAGSRHSVPADEVARAVNEIVAVEGACPPERLVQEAEARPELQPLFEWDDEVAAQRWRTQQARNVLNSLTVRVVVEDREVEAPAFLSVGHRAETADRGGGYRSVWAVVADADLRNEAKAEALALLRGVRKRYGVIRDLDAVWEAIDGA